MADPQFELMYRPPDGRGYMNLPKALDEIFIRLAKLEQVDRPRRRNFFLNLLTRNF